MDFTFTKGGKEVFKCAAILGQLGVENCVKHGKFSISWNERDNSTMTSNIAAILSHKSEVSAFVRSVLEKAESYDEAVKMIQDGQLGAPAYFIVGGMKENEGAVITKDQ